MDFALAHNVRGVTLTRPTGDGGEWMEKGLNHRTVKSSQRSLGRTLAHTQREREGGSNPQPCHGGKARPFVFVVSVVCGLSLFHGGEE